MSRARGSAPPETAKPRPAPSTIGARTSFRGEVTGPGDLVVRGALQGGARVRGRVRVVAGGSLEREIEARDIEVSGRVTGVLRARRRIVARAGCDLRGSASAPGFRVEEGARLDDLEMRFEGVSDPTPTD